MHTDSDGILLRNVVKQEQTIVTNENNGHDGDRKSQNFVLRPLPWSSPLPHVTTAFVGFSFTWNNESVFIKKHLSPGLEFEAVTYIFQYVARVV